MIPAHLEEPVSELVRCLQALTDDQLGEFAGILRQRCDTNALALVSGRLVWDADPIQGVEWSLHSLQVNEANYRQEVYQRTEAALAGGHLVSVGPGDIVNKYAAYCDPTPPDKFYWTGPDRDTVEEAVADGRGHHPGHEPQVMDIVDL